MKFMPPPVNRPLDEETAIKHAIPVLGTKTKGDHDMGFRARAVQSRMFKVLRENHNAVFVFHRRAGKTRGLLQWMIHCALNMETEGRPADAPPRLIYAAPTEKMAKAIAWTYLVHAAKSIPGCKVKESETPTVTLPNGARIEVVGAQNPDNLRGQYVDVAVLDEYAYMNSEAYHSVIRPQLLDYNGRVVFCSTPAGRNDFWRLYEKALSGELPDWGALLVTATESGVIPPDALQRLKDTSDEESFEREMMCNFDAPLKGAIWGRLINKLRQDGMVTDVPHDTTRKVIASWDIGLRDDTAIWFWQVMPGGRVHLIDHESGSDIPLSEWLKSVNSKPYDYEIQVIPHDAKQRDKNSGLSFQRNMYLAGLKSYCLPKASPQTRIEAARQVLAVAMFDQSKCERGLDALALYQRKYDAEHHAFSKNPVHDWTSHSADAFGYGAEYIAVRLGMSRPETIRSSTHARMSTSQIDKLLRGKSEKRRAMSREKQEVSR